MKVRKMISLCLLISACIVFSACGKTESENTNDDLKKQDISVGEQSKDEIDEEETTKEGVDKKEDNSKNSQSSSETNVTDKNTQSTTTNTGKDKTNNQTNSSANSNITNNKPTQEKHSHTYSNATCTKPQTCSCGATKGSALGHTYTNATCTTPNKCVCGAISGSALGHSYDENGVCSRCSTKDPNFKYPTLASMGGRWACKYEDGDSGVIIKDFIFTTSVNGCLHAYDYPDVKGTCCTQDRACVVWNGQHILCGAMDDLGFANGRFDENGDRVVIYDNEEDTLILQRTSTRAMKVLSYDSGFGYSSSKIPIGTILEFENVK